jgi:hypothetical protein
MEQKRRILLRRRNLDSAFGRPRVPAITRVRSTAVRSGSGIADKGYMRRRAGGYKRTGLIADMGLLFCGM